MRYTLTEPMIITSRLMPGVKIGNDSINVEIDAIHPDGAKITYVIDFAGPTGGRLEYVGNDITVRSSDDPDVIIREAVGTLCSFLRADAERYAAHMGAEPIEPYAFNAGVAEWAYMVSDELAMIDMEIEES